MIANPSVDFFDTQFQRQVREGDFVLNPFEQAALPYLHGRVLDYGCGMGNLAVEAARRGCRVVALDASTTAIAHLGSRASSEALPIDAQTADLRGHTIVGEFDVVVAIGLLMFFDCPTAQRVLAELQSHVRPGGTAIVNVLVQGTTFLDMFDPAGHCLFAPTELERRFAGWDVVLSERRDYPAPGGRIKSFATIIAHKPALPGESS
jgi:tellurite methyltransferase